jgi:NSS family neurotransmitter:Na+ symporter
VLGALGSLLFTHQAGLFWLDIVDHFLNTYGLLVVGLLECLVIGWFYRTDRLRDHISENSGLPRYFFLFWAFLIQYLCPIVLGILLAFSIHEEVTEPYEGYDVSALLVLGLLWVLVTLAVGIILSTIPWKKMKQEEA